MTTVYVADSYALMAIADYVTPPKINPVLNELSDVVVIGALRFPDSVWRDCVKHADDSGVAMWAKAVFGHVSKDIPGYDAEEEILDTVPELLDEGDLEWQPQIQVAALAWYLKDCGLEVVCVTADIEERPDRMSLWAACEELDIETMTVEDFLTAVISFALP